MQLRTLLTRVTVAVIALGACKEPVMVKVKNPAIDQKKFESLYRLAKTVQASVSVGLTNVKFGELQQSLATEIAIAKDKATEDREITLVSQIADAGSGLVSKGEILVARGGPRKR